MESFLENISAATLTPTSRKGASTILENNKWPYFKVRGGKPIALLTWHAIAIAMNKVQMSYIAQIGIN
jgi:hypothetical protein